MNEMLISFFEGTRECNAAIYGFPVPQRATLLIHAVSSILLTISAWSANLIIGGIDACCTVKHARRSCSNDGHNSVSLRMGRCDKQTLECLLGRAIVGEFTRFIGLWLLRARVL